jgi:hypothetical protein
MPHSHQPNFVFNRTSRNTPHAKATRAASSAAAEHWFMRAKRITRATALAG